MLIYDPANTIYGADSNTSRAANKPTMLQHETVPGSTSFDVQGRVDMNAAWLKIGSTVAASAPAAVIAIPAGYLEVRISRTGTGNFKVWAN
jgi:hypothetical protein